MDVQGSVPRKVYLDFIRIFAIFLVLFNHTDAFHCPFCCKPTTCSDNICLAISICDRVAVPLFFMVSGALLLSKEESIKQILKKRVLRYVLVILLFQVVQHGYAYWLHGDECSIIKFVMDCILAGQPPHGNAAAWFLYAYFSFLLILPLLRILVRGMSNFHFVYLFSVQLILLAFLPFTKVGYADYLPLCNQVFLYLFAGYYLENRVNIQALHRYKMMHWLLLSVGCIILSIVMCEVCRRIHQLDAPQQWMLCFQNGLLIPCCTIYLFVKKVMQGHVRGIWTKLLTIMGGAVFSIMLIENILRWLAESCIQSVEFSSIYLRDCCVVLLACCIGFPVGILLKRVPILRKLL